MQYVRTQGCGQRRDVIRHDAEEKKGAVRACNEARRGCENPRALDVRIVRRYLVQFEQVTGNR